MFIKDHPVTTLFALAAAAVYLTVAGMPNFLAWRGPFTGELAHVGLEYPLRWIVETAHANERVFRSLNREFLLFGIAGTLAYGIAGALIGCLFDAFLLRGLRRDEPNR